MALALASGGSIRERPVAQIRSLPRKQETASAYRTDSIEMVYLACKVGSYKLS